MELKPTAKPTSLRLLKESVTELKAAEDDLTSKVLNAHRCGASWAEIGSLLGITKQRAHQRYSAAARDTSRDHLYTPEENAEADKALAAIQAVAAKQDAAAEPSKIVDEDRAGDSVTPSIFLDPVAPATDWQQDDPRHFITPLHERRFGSCSYCGAKNHRDKKGGTWIYPGCSPTLTDPIYTEEGTK